MRTFIKILKWLFVSVFPVLMFDGCMNRDPYIRLDSHFTIGAISTESPMFLNYRHWSSPDFETNHWSLEDISNYRLTQATIIGNSPKGYFIADRTKGTLRLYKSTDERDQVLSQEYSLQISDFKPISWIMWLKSNWFWPYVHIYYLLCFILIPVSIVLLEKRKLRKLQVGVPTLEPKLH